MGLLRSGNRTLRLETSDGGERRALYGHYCAAWYASTTDCAIRPRLLTL